MTARPARPAAEGTRGTAHLPREPWMDFCFARRRDLRGGGGGENLEGAEGTCYVGSPMDTKTFTIGQLARDAGVPVSTVRFYERIRLLVPEGRTLGNYRVYGPSTLERLRFIRAALASGFSLEDIGALLRFRGGQKAPNRKVQLLIKERLSDLDTRAEELERVRSVLRSSLRACRRTERTGMCTVIERLSRTASATRRRNSP